MARKYDALYYLWKARATARENQSGSREPDKLGVIGKERIKHPDKREHEQNFSTCWSFSFAKFDDHNWIASSINSCTVLLVLSSFIFAYLYLSSYDHKFPDDAIKHFVISIVVFLRHNTFDRETVYFHFSGACFLQRQFSL